MERSLIQDWGTSSSSVQYYVDCLAKQWPIVLFVAQLPSFASFIFIFFFVRENYSLRAAFLSNCKDV